MVHFLTIESRANTNESVGTVKNDRSSMMAGSCAGLSYHSEKIFLTEREKENFFLVSREKEKKFLAQRERRIFFSF